MDDDVAQLVKAERLADAALLASSRGDARTACDLLERACDFSGAARQAALAGDHARALLLAVTGGDDAMAAHSLDRAVRDRAASNTLAARLIALMRSTRVPNGLAGVGYGAPDVEALARGALAQQRLLQNAPLPVDEETLKSLFLGAISYW